MSKIRELTGEELQRIKVRHYNSGFSMWMEQPGFADERVILDASLFRETGKIHCKFPKGQFTYGTFYSSEDETIHFVAIE